MSKEMKRIIDFIFGMKLPCCRKKRYHRRLGGRVSCPQCGRVYTKYKWA